MRTHAQRLALGAKPLQMVPPMSLTLTVRKLLPTLSAKRTTDGGRGSDPRVAYVPAKQFPKGARRPVYPDLEDFPRFVGYGRGKTYWPQAKNQTQTKPIGFIPQVEQTYAYLEANYGIQNEHQLSIGESTSSAVFKALPIGQGGKALFCVNQLSYIALERCVSARCAVKLMGELAEVWLSLLTRFLLLEPL